MTAPPPSAPGARDWIHALGLHPHPEGGWFSETYRGGPRWPADALPEAYAGGRDASTAIYYLLRSGECSHLHRIRQDEVWHLYAGGPATLVALHPDGRLERHALGTDVRRGQRPQVVLPGGTWFGALPDPGTPYVLAGCTVAPGFDFADFTLADRSSLLQAYPQHGEWIRTLTRGGSESAERP